MNPHRRPHWHPNENPICISCSLCPSLTQSLCYAFSSLTSPDHHSPHLTITHLTPLTAANANEDAGASPTTTADEDPGAKQPSLSRSRAAQTASAAGSSPATTSLFSCRSRSCSSSSSPAAFSSLLAGATSPTSSFINSILSSIRFGDLLSWQVSSSSSMQFPFFRSSHVIMLFSVCVIPVR